jgi:hypothetical protein
MRKKEMEITGNKKLAKLRHKCMQKKNNNSSNNKYNNNTLLKYKDIFEQRIFESKKKEKV